MKNTFNKINKPQAGKEILFVADKWIIISYSKLIISQTS